MTYNEMIEKINSLCEEYQFLSVNGLGESILGRTIPLINLGVGKKRLVYIGAQSGNEYFTGKILLRFVKEYCVAYKSRARIYGIPIEYLYERVTISVIPVLNPDGVDYCLLGPSKENPLAERVLKMNGGSHDFGNWSANARGVDLRHNYNGGYRKYREQMIKRGIEGGAQSGYCGENPNSEPETGALSNYLRYSQDTAGVLELCGDKEKLFYSSKLTNIRALGAMANIIALDKKLVDGNGELCEWCAEELSLPCLRIGCGDGSKGDEFTVYSKLRKALFCASEVF